MTATQEAPMNNLLTCTNLFIQLQAIEPLLADDRRVFITRDNHSTIHFRILDKRGNSLLIHRTYNWKDYNTPAAIRDALDTLARELHAAGLINIGNTANSQL